MMYEVTTEILMLAAIVTAFVGVAKLYGVDAKHNHLIALGIAAVFVLVPDWIQVVLVKISLIGLTASGAYHYAKTRKEE